MAHASRNIRQNTKIFSASRKVHGVNRVFCVVSNVMISNKLVHLIDLALESLCANATLGRNLLKHSFNFQDFVYHNTMFTFNGRCQCLSKFLDVIVKPDNFKIKVIPSVAEYICHGRNSNLVEF